VCEVGGVCVRMDACSFILKDIDSIFLVGR